MDEPSFACGDNLHSRVALNRGRIYDCGRVPPLPKKKGADNRDAIANNDAIHHINGRYCFKLLSFLKGSHTNRRKDAFSKSGWRRRIERGQISVDGIVVRDPEYVLSKAKQQIKYHRFPWKEPILRVTLSNGGEEEEMEAGKTYEDSDIHVHDDERVLKILYIDDHILAVHKPSGLPTMPSQTYFEYSVLNALRRLYDETNKVGNGSIPQTPTNVFATTRAKELIHSHCSVQPQPVHRLGVGTSGVLVVATSLLGRQRLTDAIRLKSNNRGSNECGTRIRKVYRALVYSRRCDDRPGNGSSDTNSNTDEDGFPSRRDGPVIPECFTIDCPIGLVPFPIGGDSIHAACPFDSNSLYGHVHTKGNRLENCENNTICDDSVTGIDSSKPNCSKTKSTTKSSLSHVRVLCRKTMESIMEETAVVEVEIPTGRPHQIRIHMAYAGYPLVDDPLYLPGGIPNTLPRNFESLEKEKEDMETDDENGNEEDDANEKTETTLKKNVVFQDCIKRVALPRDCGYYLHAHTITLEHPCSESSFSEKDGDSLVTKNSSISHLPTTMTFVAPPPPILRG